MFVCLLKQFHEECSPLQAPERPSISLPPAGKLTFRMILAVCFKMFFCALTLKLLKSGRPLHDPGIVWKSSSSQTVSWLWPGSTSLLRNTNNLDLVDRLVPIFAFDLEAAYMYEVKGHRFLHIILTLVCCGGLHLFVTGVGRESLKLSYNQLFWSLLFLSFCMHLISSSSLLMSWLLPVTDLFSLLNTWLTSSLCTSIERGRSFTPSMGCCHLAGICWYWSLMLSSEDKHFLCNWVFLPGLHRGAVQAWYLLSQGRTWLGRRNWLDFGWKWMDIAERSTGILIRNIFFAHVQILLWSWNRLDKSLNLKIVNDVHTIRSSSGGTQFLRAAARARSSASRASRSVGGASVGVRRT